jgi:hypothetical protein
MLQRLNVFHGDKVAEFRNRRARTGEDVRHYASVKTDAPKSSVKVSPLPTVKLEP